MHTDNSNNWKSRDGVLSPGMIVLSEYLQTWRQKLSYSKTTTAAFHVNNREAKLEPAGHKNNSLLPFCPNLGLLLCKTGQIIDVSLPRRSTAKKLTSRVALFRRLKRSKWAADAKTLRIATLSQIYSTSENCAPVWCCSTHDSIQRQCS